MKTKSMWVALLTILCLISLATPAHAQAPEPGWVEPPPQPVQSAAAAPLSSDSLPQIAAAPLSEAPDANLLQAVGLPPLKAVLVVGPLDPEDGNQATRAEIANMELAANVLLAHGVQVTRLYPPNDTWANLVAAANDANFLLYRGHGVAWDENIAAPTVGGFALSERLFSSEDIRRDLQLAPNAIVMLYACYSTGTSSTDTTSAISQAEARRRASQYSQPFFDLGAAGYYADWFGDAFQVYLENLFAGETLADAFRNYGDYQADLSATLTHQFNPGVPLILSWDNWADPYPLPGPQYNSTFAGQSDQTLWDLFQPTLELTTHSLAYIAKPSAAPRTYQVTVASSNSVSLAWSATPASGSVDWVSYTPTAGETNTTLEITFTPPATSGKFATTLTVTAAGLEEPQTIDLVLITTPDPGMVFLPNIIH